jgi:phosphoribosylformimino-5-aminoimidazole carboxamide ribotide isomerase
MNVIPAIDLMNGVVVRLVSGDAQTATIYRQFGNPTEVALKWEREGADTIHIIDLDAAQSSGDNKSIVANIVDAVGIPVQLGGGIRSGKKAEEMFSLGVQKVILGTLAFERSPELLTLLQDYGKDRVMVALDYLHNHVMIRGWKNATPFTVKEALDKFLDLGVDQFLLTSVLQDGRLTGPDHILLNAITRNYRAHIYAAGGISSVTDLARLKGVGVAGVVVGRALYEGRFTLNDAIEITKTERDNRL